MRRRHQALHAAALPMLAYYLFFAGLLAGPAWIGYHYFDLNRYPAGNDIVSYLRLAEGKAPANPVHFYRVAVPLAARVLADAVSMLAPNHDRQELIRGAFFVVNLAITAAAALVLFLMLLDFVGEPGYALLGVLAFLLSRDVIDETGLPSIDSLLFLTVAASFYAIRVRSAVILAVVLLLGPAVKENFAFLVPILFFFGALSKRRILALLIVGYGLAFAIRSAVDVWLHTAQIHNLAAAFSHAGMIPGSIHKLLDGHGELTLMMAFGPFWLILALGFFGGAEARAAWLKRLDAPLLWWLPLVCVQMLLSGNLSRMAVLAFPTMGAAVALILSRHPIAVSLVRGLGPASRAIANEDNPGIPPIEAETH
ncbi:MAG TPA: hypothetical protein VMD75_04145 [Candidatus Binataceae bacterium]|nr:hypothetical protein [Candidatus Binataceae bacterium]